MSVFFWRLQAITIAAVMLQSSAISNADTCVGFSKRAPLKVVCGRVIDIAGAKLKDVKLTLTGEDGSVLFSTLSDAEGRFSFSSIPAGDYTLHAKADGYHEPERQIHAISSKLGNGATGSKLSSGLGFAIQAFT